MAKSRKYGRKVKTMRKKNRRRGGKCGCSRGGKHRLRGGREGEMSAAIFARNTNSVITDPIKY